MTSPAQYFVSIYPSTPTNLMLDLEGAPHIPDFGDTVSKVCEFMLNRSGVQNIEIQPTQYFERAGGLAYNGYSQHRITHSSGINFTTRGDFLWDSIRKMALDVGTHVKGLKPKAEVHVRYIDPATYNHVEKQIKA